MFNFEYYLVPQKILMNMVIEKLNTVTFHIRTLVYISVDISKTLHGLDHPLH